MLNLTSRSRPCRRPGVLSRVMSMLFTMAVIMVIGMPVGIARAEAGYGPPASRIGFSRQAQACQNLAPPESSGSFAARDVWKFDHSVTLTHGSVIGYQDYWTEEADSTADIFRATSGDGLFLAGDYPAGTPLGTVWDELCPVLAGMGSIIEQGVEPEGSIYALMILPNEDGSQRHGLARVLYAHKSEIPVFAILIAPADTFSIALGEADGVGVNGIRAFEDLDQDALLASLQSGGTPGGQETGQPGGGGEQATLGSGTVVTWSEPWGDPYIEPNSVNLMTDDGTVFNVIAWPASEHTAESAAALTPAGQYTVYDRGPEANGGYYQLSGQTIFDPNLGDERTFFAYSRAWPSADGQWVIATQLQSMTPFFSRDLMSIPASITLDGTSLWGDVDAAAIIAIAEEAGVDMSSEEVAVTETPEPASTTAPETPEPASSAAPGQGTSPRDVIANQPRGLPKRDEAPEGAYVSDQFGYTVEWADHWSIYEDWTDANAEEGYDAFALETTDDGYAAIIIHGAAWDDAYTTDDYVAWWTSDEFLEEYQPDGTEVILADASRRSGAVVMVGPASDTDDELWVTVYEVAVIDRELKVESSFVAPLDGFEVAYEDARASVSMDGDEVVGFFTVEEIMDELP